MIEILILILKAKTIKEIDEIVFKYLDVISQDPFLLYSITQMRERIILIEKIKKEISTTAMN